MASESRPGQHQIEGEGEPRSTGGLLAQHVQYNEQTVKDTY